MKPVPLIVVALAVAGFGFYGYKNFEAQTRQAQYERDVAALKQAFLIDNASMSLLDEAAYSREVGTHLSRYFKKLEEIGRKHPGSFHLERELLKMEADEKAGKKLNEAQKEARKERIDLAIELFKRMRDGQYRPAYTAADKGFRFDILDVTPQPKEQSLKVLFVHWGPFGAAAESSGPVTYRNILGNIRVAQVKGKPVELQRFEGDDQPPSLTFAPERWVSEMIPGISVGYYELPQLPRNSEGLQLNFDFGLRTVGGSEVTATVKFPEIAVPEAWKLPEGATWDAQERTATDEELQAAGASRTAP